jgi:mono/diheme cytochrome c family protein
MALAGCDVGPRDEKYVPPRQATLTPARPIPPGAAPRGTSEYTAALVVPGPPLTASLLRQGREAYGVFCTPCHGPAGDGDGTVTRHGFVNLPSFHDGRLLAVEPARIVTVISDGYGKMLPLAERIPPGERWAIAYYVKALQLSGRPPDVPGTVEPGGAPQ